MMSCPYAKSDLKKQLTPLQYQVTQEKGTERAFTGKYYRCKDSGLYCCVVCGQQLFSSSCKFDSGCGWPSFNDVLNSGKVTLTKDVSHVGGNILVLIANPGLVRTEVSCSVCGAHLGHVFDDGPKPTGKRFCINSASLDFRAGEQDDARDNNIVVENGTSKQSSTTKLPKHKDADNKQIQRKTNNKIIEDTFYKETSPQAKTNGTVLENGINTYKSNHVTLLKNRFELAASKNSEQIPIRPPRAKHSLH